MRQFAMTIKIRPGCASEYKRYHAAVWPEVLEMIRQCYIRNYSIFLKDDTLFGYFEYHGKDLDWISSGCLPIRRPRNGGQSWRRCSIRCLHERTASGGLRWKRFSMWNSFRHNSPSVNDDRHSFA